MAIEPQDIKKLCELARLAIADEDLPDVTAQLANIVALVDELQAVDTAGIEPLAHPLEQPQRLRDDSVTETDQREIFQRNAARTAGGLYLVPKVIE